MRRRIASKGAGCALLTAAMLGAVLLSGTAAVAQEKEKKSMIPGTFSANVALTSEYYFRGISQTDDKPALQGGFDYEVAVAKPVSVYLGVWGSNVDFNESTTDGASVEIDWYGGLRGKIADTGLSWDVGAIYYSYPGANADFNYNFWEAVGSLGYDFGVASVTASLNWTPDNTTDLGEGRYSKFAVDVPVPGVENLTLSAYVADVYIEKGDSYLEWNFSAGYNVLGFDLSLAYSDTDISPEGDGNSEAVIFTVSRSF